VENIVFVVVDFVVRLLLVVVLEDTAVKFGLASDFFALL